MLYALAHPPSLLCLLLSFVVGVTLQGWASSLVADRVGDRRPGVEGRLKPDPRRHVDPFGALAAAISGMGWARPVELPSRKGAAAAVALAGPIVNLVLGVGLLVAWRAAYGPLLGTPDHAYLLQHGLSSSGGGALLFLAGLSQLFLGALALVPLPPLPGGRLMLALAPRSPGWQQAELQLVERNIGIAVLLVLLLLPLGGSVPILPQLLDIVLTPLARVICGG